MGLHGVPQLVDGLQGGVAGGVVADGVAGAGDVVVDGAGDAHHGEAPLRQAEQALEGAVAADADERIQAQHLAGGHGTLLAGGGLELLAAGGVEHGAAPAGQIADALKIQLGKIAVDQTVIAAPDAHALNTHVLAGTGHSTDSGIHAGGVSPAGKHADAAHCFFHVESPFLYQSVKPSVLFHGPPGHRHTSPTPDPHRRTGTPPPAPDTGRCSGRAPDGRSAPPGSAWRRPGRRRSGR